MILCFLYRSPSRRISKNQRDILILPLDKHQPIVCYGKPAAESPSQFSGQPCYYYIDSFLLAALLVAVNNALEACCFLLLIVYNMCITFFHTF